MERTSVDMQKLHEGAVMYLDKTKQIEVLRQKSELYHQNMQSVYFYTIHINTLDLVDCNAILGNIILNQPQLGTKIFQEVVYFAVKALALVDGNPACSQISVHIKLTSIPNLPSYLLKPTQLLKGQFESRYLQFEGIICSTTTKTKYTKCAKFRCPFPTCVGALESSHIRFHSPGVRESQTIRKDFSCMYCAANLIEDVHHRILGDKLVVQMVDSVALVSPSHVTSTTPKRNQSIVAYFRDELVESMHLGGSYKIIGIPVKEVKGATTDVFIEVNNIIPLYVKDLTVPGNIQKVFSEHCKSPWGFVSRLVATFGTHISPKGTYNRLKLAILLSLVQTTTDNKNTSHLNILAVGSSTHIMSRLLALGTKLVNRSITTITAEHMFASVSSETFGTGVCSINGGSLSLSDNGVCIVGEVSAFKRDTLERLTATLEKNTETVNIPRRFVESSNVEEVNIPLRCCVWGTFYAATCNSQHLMTYDRTPVKTSYLSQAFKLGFNMVCICNGMELSSDELVDEKLVYTLLSSAMSPKDNQGNDYNIDMEDLRQFVLFARDREVRLSRPAEILLRGYFVGSRRARASNLHAVPMAQSALQTLLCLAHAHAKLSLRDEVSMEDATLAVLLYEEAMTVRFGFSVLSVKPSLILNQLSTDNDHEIYQFQSELIRFYQTHAAEVFTSEE